MLKIREIARSPLTYAGGTLLAAATTANLYMNTGKESLERAVDCGTPELQRIGGQICRNASSEFMIDSSATLAGMAATGALIVATAITGSRSLRRRVLENEERIQAAITPTDQQSAISL